MDSILFMIFLQVFLIGLNAIFACAEIAVISMNDTKLAKMASQGDKRAIKLEKLTSQPARFLATIQVAITLSGFLGSAFAAENFSGVLVDWLVGLGVGLPESVLDSIAVVFITIVLSYFTLVFGELLPKQIAMRKSESLALAMSGLVYGISKIFAPLVSFLTMTTNACLKLIGINPDAEEDNVSEEEIRMMVDVGSEKGTIDNEEREFIQNVFEFDDLTVRELVTHRTDAVMLDMEEDDDAWKNIVYNTQHSLYPICEGSVDKVVGILDSKKYLKLEDKSRAIVMEEAVSPAYYVPDRLKADVLFKNMKKHRQKIAVVLDEYGGMTGIVTINDLIEQLVGKFDDYNEENVIEKLADNKWKVKGCAALEEVEETLGITLPCDEYETFNGLVFHALGKIPEDSEELHFTYGNLDVIITELKEHQVENAIISVQTDAH